MPVHRGTHGAAALAVALLALATPAAAQTEPMDPEPVEISEVPPEGTEEPLPELPPEPEPEPEPEPTPEPLPEPEPEPEPVPPAPSPTPDPEPEEPPELEQPPLGERILRGFGFGSYGRVGVGTDMLGSTARPVSVVAHSPRVVEGPYIEMDLYYDVPTDGPWAIRTTTTLALLEDLFHYTGDFSSMLALRNAFVSFVWNETVEVWAGSRMYRGDDIYLLDYWPLDNLNPLGGGVGLRLDRFELRFHAGANRLADDFAFQETDVPARLFGAERVVLMDRQRTIASLGASYRLLGEAAGPALRLKVYLEFHHLAPGTLRYDDRTTEDLPEDFGWVGGIQLGAWGFGERLSHANLFLRYGQGLGAFNEMAIPFGFDADKRTFPRANELVIGLSANYERGIFGVMGGGYVRRFVDADPNLYDEDDGWEFVLDVRPSVVLWGPLQAAVDLSYQQRFPTGMSPSALELMSPAIFQVAPMLVFAPLGPGSYSRPHIRVLYRLAYLNEGALDLYATEDPRADEQLVHYLGIQVEWWFNSSYR